MISIGQPWGSYTASFLLPAITVRFSGLSSNQHAEIRQRYPKFIEKTCEHTDSHELGCQVYRLEKPPPIPKHQLTWDGQYAPLIERRAHLIQLTGHNFQAQFRMGSSTALGSLGVSQSHEFSQSSVVENFLRVFSAYKVLQQQGVMLHSAGLVDNKRAYIFSGRSNAGKTTLTCKAHAAGYKVLSDDINLLLPEANGVYHAHKVPFTGEFGRTLEHEAGRGSYPVAVIVLLEQGDKLAVSPGKNSSSVARLLTACPFVNVDSEETACLFDILTDLVKRVPVVRLQARRDDTIEAIMDGVKKEIGHE